MAANDEKEVKTGSETAAANVEKPAVKAEEFTINPGNFREEKANANPAGTAPDKEKEAIAARIAEIRANGSESGANLPPPAAPNGPAAPGPKVVEATVATPEDERKELAELGFTATEIDLMMGSGKGLTPKKAQLRNNLLKEKSRRRKQRTEEEQEKRKEKQGEAVDQARDAASTQAKIDAVRTITGEMPARALRRMGEILAENHLAEDFGRALARSYATPDAALEWKNLILHYPLLTSLACGLGHPIGPVLIRPFGVVGEIGFKAAAVRVINWFKGKLKRGEKPPEGAAAASSPKAGPVPLNKPPPAPEVPKAAPADDDDGVPLVVPPL